MIEVLENGLEKAFVTDTGEAPAHSLRGFQGERPHQINTTGLLRRWSWKEHFAGMQGSLCMFVKVSQET